jgi:glycosyltransferase involved in cell wall biosynthesis
MACGCPCLVSDIPALRETVGDAGVRVDFTDVAQAAGELQRILTDGKHAAALRGCGLRRAADFSFERLTRERVGGILQRLG